MKSIHTNLRTFLCAAAALGAVAAFAAPEAKISLDVAHPAHSVPKTLFGIFFEDINFAADGGLYPELIANRGFDWQTAVQLEWPSTDRDGWRPDNRGGAMARLTRQYTAPLNDATPAHLRIECFGPGQGCGVRNDGYKGIAVQAGKKYDLSFYVRPLAYKGTVRVLLEDSKGALLASYSVPLSSDNEKASGRVPAGNVKAGTWSRFSSTFVPSATVHDAHLSILLDAPGTVELEQVSLFPQDTFNGRKNGLRKDLVQLLKDLHPGIMRFPGGCLTEGRDFNLWYDWKLSVGDGSLESRACLWNGSWGYWQTLGLGFYEYFCLCEDIGCEPLPVLGAGLTCQFSRPVNVAPLSAMDYFAQNLLDLIEFANGDVSTHWGAIRAKMGHPKPFNLHYLGIGNENWDKVFTDRFIAIAAIVRAKHPEIRIVSSSGPGPDGRNFDHAWRTLNPGNNADVIDEHYYVKPEWALASANRYDNRSRTGSRVYAGEYAVHMNDRANSLYSALCEAALMTGFERNSDLVEMSSYAPLFAKVGCVQWKPDLIWFDNVSSFGTPNYYVQQLFMRNLPTRTVPVSLAFSATVASPVGPVALQTYRTAVEFKDIRVVGKGGAPLAQNLRSLDDFWAKPFGAWVCENGLVRQTDNATENTRLRLGKDGWSDYTVTLKVRKLSGQEGFIVAVRDRFGQTVRLNFGGWDNSQHALEAPESHAVPGSERPGAIETGRWYDLRIVLDGDAVSAWLDGRQLWDRVRIPCKTLPGLFATAGLDDAANELVVKCVNATESAQPVALDFGGTRLPAGTATRVVLAGDPAAVNDLDHPTRVAPVTDSFAFPGGASATITFAPSSLTVLRFKITP